MRAMFENKTGYIYFIQMDLIGPIKIGIAQDPYRRMAELQVASPYELKMLYFFPSTMKTEREIHNLLSNDNIRGEWFHPTRKVLSEIEEQKTIDKRMEKWNWEEWNPVKDLRDFSIKSDYWESEEFKQKTKEYEAQYEL